jgi:hypothetical protein
MYRHVVIFLLSCPVAFFSSAADERSDPRVEAAVGAIVVYNETQLMKNRGSRNSLELSKLIDIKYESIRTLDPELRCDFFWTIATTVELDGGYSYDFCALIAKDCRKQFLARGRNLLDAPGDIDQRRLSIVKRYFDSITQM